MLFAFWIIVYFLVGAAFGSFLNVVIDRVPAGQSIIFPPSHCSNSDCRKKLGKIDLIPILSFLLLRGQCRYCGIKIGWRSFWVELGTALTFPLLYANYGLSWNMLITIVFVCIFIVLIVTDMESGILPDKIIYPAMIIAFSISAAVSILSILDIDSANIIIPGIGSALLGGVTGFLFFFIAVFIFKGGIGGGDIKLAGMIGLLTGFPNILVAIWLGVVAGGIVAIVLLIKKIKARKQTIPFGPFLCIAAIATLLWGKAILDWYLNIAGFNPF